jgi:solute carrier family 39 (zinc transporter), member 7
MHTHQHSGLNTHKENASATPHTLEVVMNPGVWLSIMPLLVCVFGNALSHIADGFRDHNHTQTIQHNDRSFPRPNYFRSYTFIVLRITMVSSSALAAALLSTGFISLVPNVILFAFPGFADEGAIKGSLILAMGQALAAGGLLGDVFLHTMPEANEDAAGLWVLAGFSLFLIMDMLIRSLEGDDDHHQSHTNTKTNNDEKLPTKRSAISIMFSSSILLNLTADALHNFTDGLAIGASFATAGVNHSTWQAMFTSRGGTATLAILLHEIPHELGDYCILLKNGFTKNEAIATQFFTATAAFVGTFVGLWAASTWPGVNYITAGGFVYLAAVTILPKVLEERKASFLFRLCQLIAFLIGIGFLFSVSLLEGEDGHGHSHQHNEHAVHEEIHHQEHHHQGHDHGQCNHEHHGHHDHHDHGHGHEL